MTGFVFSNRFDTGGYYGGVVAGETALDLQILSAVGFVAPEAPPGTDFTLEEAWANKTGAVVLLGEAPSNPAEFAKLVLKRLVNPGVHLLWIANPADAPEAWNTAVFPLTKAGDALALKSAVDMELTGEADGYMIRFAKGTVVTADPASNQLKFTGGAMAFGRSGQLIVAAQDALNLTLDVPTGPALSFEFAIPGGDAVVESLDGLGLGFWYSVSGGSVAGSERRKAYRYPLFQGHSQHDGLVCSAQITPSRLLDPAVSRITCDPATSAKSNFVTWFRSIYGYSITASLKTSLGMVFNAAGEGGFGLSPDGTLALSFSDQTSGKVQFGDDHKVLGDVPPPDGFFACGSAGTERIRVPADQLSKLSLDMVTGCRASVDMDGDEIALTAATTTAWVRLSAESELFYEAQPAGEGALYDVSDASAPPVSILPYFPPIPVPIQPGALAPLIPMVPLAGLQHGAEQEEVQLEATGIGPARKAQLTGAEKARLAAGGSAPILPTGLSIAAGETRYAVTPRGLEATFDDSGWVSVQIARLLGKLEGNSGNLQFSGPEGIVDPFKSALQTSQQFIVISDPEAIRKFFSNREIPTPPDQADELEINTEVTLRHWEFLLGPENWDEHQTILIIKNTPEAMQSLLADTSAWTSAEEFNTNVASVSRRLLQIAKDARAGQVTGRQRLTELTGEEEDLPEQDFDFFVNTVLSSPDWNGILFLNGKLGKFPEDLAGMRAGIKPEKLFAHHIGVTQTPFQSVEEIKTQSRSSSMFGLIRYDDQSPLTGDGLNYTFRVRELSVQFADSEIRDFRSTVDLAIGKVFGQRSRIKQGDYAVSEMIGTRHERGGGYAYSFTAVNPIELELGTGPLRKAVLLQGEFVTKSVADEINLQGMTNTAFNFAGYLEFEAVKSGEQVYDVFSFKELAFANLSVDMDFLTHKPESPKYTFSIDDLELSEALSVSRDKSLFDGFPIKLEKLVRGTGAPDAQGSMTVGLPVSPAKLTGEWYGVSQIIDMGTLSDVAGAAGLEARLITAWGKEPGQYHIGLDVSGPSLSGLGLELKLLSVLKLKAYSLNIRCDDGQWTLLMGGMTMSVFSKSLPPGGAFEFYIFGVPDPTGSANSLGWYGAWIADESEEGDTESGLDRLRQEGLPGAMPLLTSSPRLRYRNTLNTQEDEQCQTPKI